MSILPHETEIRGEWKLVGGRMEADANCRRIEALTSGPLRKVAMGPSGAWEVLYVDPADGRYWELTYPQGEMHGGGPPLLECISRDEARKKYGDGAVSS